MASLSTVRTLVKRKFITPPPFVEGTIQYEVITGSLAYGVAKDTSDFDINGFCIPPQSYIFPHMAGEIQGFGKKTKRFDQYQQHHIHDPSAQGGAGRSYDVSIYNIVKFFQLCMENNPNMLDLLFVPRDCVLFSTEIGERVRSSASLFVHKGSFHKFRGYAYSQLQKLRNKVPSSPKRAATVAKYGYDTKYAYHLVRLLLEAEQLLETGKMDLRRDSEFLRAIRAGEYSMEKLEEFFTSKEDALNALYVSSSIPHSPDEEAIKSLLLSCLEIHYGSLASIFPSDTVLLTALESISRIANEATQRKS